MTDLPERLRTRYGCTAGYTRDIYPENERDLDLLAAAEIERLSAENERLQLDSIHTCHDRCQRTECVLRRELNHTKKLYAASSDNAARYRAENERLREKNDKLLVDIEALWLNCDPCNMYAKHEAVWRKYHNPESGDFRAALGGEGEK